MSYITNVWLLAAQGHSPWGMIEAQRLTPNGNFGESVVAGRTLQCASLRFTLPKLRPAPVLPRGLTCQQSRLRHLHAALPDTCGRPGQLLFCCFHCLPGVPVRRQAMRRAKVRRKFPGHFRLALLSPSSRGW